MVEKLYQFTQSDARLIERIVEDAHAAINHVVLAAGEALPEHHANSNVYLILVRGSLALRLNEQPVSTYVAGSIISIPDQTKMNLANAAASPLEFFIVKAPSPKG